MKISFLDFWVGFNPFNNFFINCIKLIRENVQIVHPSEADLIIYGEFGDEHRNYNCRKFCFIGENNRPTNRYDQCEISFSSDYETYDGKNFRIPLWYFYVDWFNVKSYGNPSWLIPLNYFDQPNEFSLKPKNKFCTIVFNDPYEDRISTINLLNNYKQIDVYGSQQKNSIPDGEKNKLHVISDYKFSICYEGPFHPGWYTEKLLHAKIAGNIPIYHCDNETFHLEFNPKCCINLNSFESIESLIEKIIEIDNDENLYQEILNEPTFSKPPSIDHVLTYLNKTL